MNRAEWTEQMALGGFAFLASVCLIGLLPQLARADEAAEKKGAALMDKYVEATGGKAAYDAIKSRIVKGQQLLPGDMTAKFELYWVAPDKFRSIVELPRGTLDRGSDGITVWISFPTGARIFEGAQRIAAIRDSTQDRFGRWRTVFQKAEYVGEENVDGTSCAKVVLTLKPIDPKVEEPPVTVFIAEDSGLIVQWTGERPGSAPGGQDNVAVTFQLSDYKKVGDLTVPHQMKIAVQDDEITIKTEEVIFNAEIPADRFVMPEAVKEQLKENEEGKKSK